MIKRFIGFNLFIVIMLASFSSMNVMAAEDNLPLKEVVINIKDKAALQRGAKLYMNYCSGCHSLKYLRYTTIAKGLGLFKDSGEVDKDLLMNNLVFTKAKAFEPIEIAMLKQDARQWFGIIPPDLSLIARVRGENWLYTYLTSFYADNKRPFGANNLLFPEVAMPNVLAPLQGKVIPIYKTHHFDYQGENKEEKVISYLQKVEDGHMSTHQFNQSIKDIVTFLSYVSEPYKLQRLHIGYWVMLFLLVFVIVAYLLKRAYWKEIK